MTFEDLALHDSIKKSIANLGYTQPTPVQAKAIPLILEGRDVVACAQTGTGKTAAFVLPALHRLSTTPRAKHPRILILTPTRELATQITKAAFQYGRQTRVNMASLVGGMSYQHQIRDLQRGADIIVATPGRLMDHLEAKRVDLSKIEMLILDEADRMLDMGFIDDVRLIASKTPSDRQTLLFSATLDNQLNRIIQELLRDPERFDLSQKQLTAPKIKQTLYKTKSMHDKVRVLKQLLTDNNIFKAIIFTATKMGADDIADELHDAGFASGALHGDLRQNVRTRTLDSLRRGKIQYLVATDVAARGIDISDITHVINFDLPRQSEDYVHRIGRTGRAGRDGEAISFVSNADMLHIQRIERYLGQRLRLVQLVEGATEVQEISPERPFVKNDDTRFEKSGYGYGKKRENERRERGFQQRQGRGSDKSGFGKREFSRGDKPRFERSDKPRFERSDKPRFERSDKPKFERSGDKPRFERERNENSRYDRSERSEKRPRHGEFRAINKEDTRTNDRRFEPRSPERSRDMNPFAKPEKRSYMNDNEGNKPRRQRSSADFQPFKKKSDFRAKSRNEAKPFQKREKKSGT